jgi:hypothetical protein
MQYNTARYDPAAPINSAIAGAVSDTTATAGTAGKKGADKGNTAKDTKAISPLKVPLPWPCRVVIVHAIIIDINAYL